MRSLVAFALALACCSLPAAARTPVKVGVLASGAVDGITDVPGVRVAHVTKVEGTNVRTGATGIVPNDDIWDDRLAAATYALNGNGEMTGTHWIDEAGFLEEPIVLTDTLDVGRADDGVVSWQIAHHPGIGVREDVPLPVVAECDDQGINDIQGRYVHAEDVVAMLDAAKPGDFARGNVGAGAGMRAFGFAAGIGSSSRVLPADLGGYTAARSRTSCCRCTRARRATSRRPAAARPTAASSSWSEPTRRSTTRRCSRSPSAPGWASRAAARRLMSRAETCSSRSRPPITIRAPAASPARCWSATRTASTRCTKRQSKRPSRRSTTRSSARIRSAVDTA
jgi:hypothetical protein